MSVLSLRTVRQFPTRSGALLLGLAVLAGCSAGSSAAPGGQSPAPMRVSDAPNPDPRIGLKAGLHDAGQAIWNMRLVSATPSPERFASATHSDLAFVGNYVIQGNYNGPLVYDISNPARPVLVTSYFCPASQNDVSVYRNLLFVSSESGSGRLDCAAGGVREAVSHERMRGIRIFDITDIRNPRYIHSVQTCRGSHTHTVLVSPSDPDNVYIYVSGSAGVRPAEELAGCVREAPSADPNSSLFRIEVIRVPLADPTKAAIVSSPRIFNDLTEAPRHGASPADREELLAAQRRGEFIVTIGGEPTRLPNQFARQMLDSIVRTRGGTGAPTTADSAALRAALPDLIARMMGGRPARPGQAAGPRPGPNQCHDITVYPAIGLAGGACEGYGLLLDISDPANPRRIDAVADSNFSYWHNATFSNDGSKVIFGDEWGGGGQAKCRALDPMNWGADALFSIENRRMRMRSYYKMPAPQTVNENCVAHNGSLIPIPGRDVMVQSWYQGGISVFDFTDIDHPTEIAFFDRGPSDSTQMGAGGTWSVYWYNGALVSSEIARGLDILTLAPSSHLSQNEIDAANTVRLEYLNAQGQPKFTWPASYALSKAYVDQLARSNGLNGNRVTEVREALASAERMGGSAQRSALTTLANSLDADLRSSRDPGKLRMLGQSLRDLAARQ